MPRRPIDINLYPLTQGYGNKDSIYRKGYHTGADYGCSFGSPIYAPADGQMTWVPGYNGGFGNTIKITHNTLGNKRMQTWLCHVSDMVGGNRYVKEGELVGHSGGVKSIQGDGAGLTFGAHLHWQVVLDGNYDLDINPVEVLNAAYVAAETGGFMQPMTEAREAQLYREFLGREKEFAGASGRSEQQFFYAAAPELAGTRQQLADVRTALLNEQAKPPKEIIKEVQVIVEKPVEIIKEVKVYEHDQETKENVSAILKIVKTIRALVLNLFKRK